jgi:hypothetical protein
MRSRSFVTSIILISVLLAGCGLPVEEPTPTAVPTDTPAPTQPLPPTDTPTPMPEPTSTPMAITTFEDLAGDWRRKAEDITVKIKVDKDGNASATGLGSVTLWWEDGLLHWKEASYEGCPGTIAIYKITGGPGEYITIKQVDDPCNRIGITGKWSYFGPP